MVRVLRPHEMLERFRTSQDAWWVPEDLSFSISV